MQKLGPNQVSTYTTSNGPSCKRGKHPCEAPNLHKSSSYVASSAWAWPSSVQLASQRRRSLPCGFIFPVRRGDIYGACCTMDEGGWCYSELCGGIVGVREQGCTSRCGLACQPRRRGWRDLMRFREDYMWYAYGCAVGKALGGHTHSVFLLWPTGLKLESLWCGGMIGVGWTTTNSQIISN
jgi:hypothetical protein